MRKRVYMLDWRMDVSGHRIACLLFFISHFAFSFYVRVWGYDLDLRANNTLLFSPPFL